MKRNVILLVDGDADLSSIVLLAAADQALDVRLARSARDGFGICPSPMDDVAAIIIDLDSGLQALKLLAALQREARTPAVIAISSLEETFMREVALAYGAGSGLSKPVSREELRKAIARAVAEAEGIGGGRCDGWGHPCPDCACSPAKLESSALSALTI